MKETVNHPAHYGGADNPYEVIKVIEAWKLGFNLGNTVKYIGRAGNKGSALEDLKKAAWYLNHQIEKIEMAEIHAALTEQFKDKENDAAVGERTRSRIRALSGLDGKRSVGSPSSKGLVQRRLAKRGRRGKR
jgi:hypothetical protein